MCFRVAATNATDVTSPPVPVQKAQEGLAPDQTEIIITATKREENMQNVPISVQVLGTRKLDQLNISNFEQYTKQLPSVTFQTAQPGFTTVYMRGIATGQLAAFTLGALFLIWYLASGRSRLTP